MVLTPPSQNSSGGEWMIIHDNAVNLTEPFNNCSLYLVESVVWILSKVVLMNILVLG